MATYGEAVRRTATRRLDNAATLDRPFERLVIV